MIYELLVRPLSSQDREQYYAEAVVMEQLLDIPEGGLPRTSVELDAYMREMLASGRIAVTAFARNSHSAKMLSQNSGEAGKPRLPPSVRASRKSAGVAS